MNENNFIEQTRDFSKHLYIELVKQFFVFEEIPSTNAKAKDLARAGKVEGTIVLSQIQKKGRGRFDRVWESPEGGLYFSILLRPKCKPEKATLLPLLAALSVCKTITSICDLNVTIKWPNDVQINGKKVSGILLESEANNKGLDYVVLGIGINLNTDIDLLPEEVNATSIANEIGIKLDYYVFLKKVLLNLDKYYTLFNEKKYESILQEWKKHSDTIGRKIRIELSNENIDGTASDVDESGFLIVKTDAGDIKKITSGNCLYFD